MQETLVQSLGWEDPLEEMATHSSILARKIPGTRGAWHARVHGRRARTEGIKEDGSLVLLGLGLSGGGLVRIETRDQIVEGLK